MRDRSVVCYLYLIRRRSTLNIFTGLHGLTEEFPTTSSHHFEFSQRSRISSPVWCTVRQVAIRPFNSGVHECQWRRLSFRNRTYWHYRWSRCSLYKNGYWSTRYGKDAKRLEVDHFTRLYVFKGSDQLCIFSLTSLHCDQYRSGSTSLCLNLGKTEQVPSRQMCSICICTVS